MTDQERKAMELALEALEWSWGGEPLGTKEFEAMTALRQALTQGEQEPESWMGISDNPYCNDADCNDPNGRAMRWHNKLIELRMPGRTTIAKPEQEPVAWDIEGHGDPSCMPDDIHTVPLYGAPVSKPWVSLTDEAIEKATRISVDELLDHIYENGTTTEGVGYRVNRIVKAIEAALRSKNHEQNNS